MHVPFPQINTKGIAVSATKSPSSNWHHKELGTLGSNLCPGSSSNYRFTKIPLYFPVGFQIRSERAKGSTTYL